MDFLQSYQFELLLNDAEIEINPVNYNFSMQDSIHTFYSKIRFELKDYTGLFQNVLLNTEGLNLNISYGIKDSDKLSNKYVIIDDDNWDNDLNDSISGTLAINAYNSFYAFQTVLSDIYTGRISDIIRNRLISSYIFNSVNINDTGNDDTWLRPSMDECDFINEILLDNSFSNNSNNSPFFCWIDSNNEFNFRNYHSMITATPKAKFVYQYLTQQFLTPNTILQFKRVKTGSLVHKKFWNRTLYTRNRDSGEYLTEQDHIYDYPTNNNSNNLLIIRNDRLSGYHDLFYNTDGENPGVTESLYGRKINSTVNGMFLERFILSTPLNPILKAGDCIEIEFPLKNTNKDKKMSSTYSGIYLIEKSDHIWNGDNKKGRSDFIVSRKFFEVSNDSLIKPRLF